MNPRAKKQLINTYNKSARELSEYFQGIGPRVKDITNVFNYFPKERHLALKVIEIGCGDGRDAKEII